MLQATQPCFAYPTPFSALCNKMPGNARKSTTVNTFRFIYLIAISIFAHLFFAGPVLAQVNTGLLSPGSNTGNSVTDPQNAYASDNQYTVFPTDRIAEVDYASFGISIPAGKVIHGIETFLEGKKAGAATQQFMVSLSWNGGATYTLVKSTTTISTTETSVTLGSAGDTWGRQWSASDLTDLRVRVQLTYGATRTASDYLSLDHLQVRIHYADAPCTPPPAPAGSTAQAFTTPATVANLAATGTNIKWYDAATGGNLLAASTDLSNGVDYFASQTVDGCESASRLKVAVTTNSTPAITSLSPVSGTVGSVVVITGTDFTGASAVRFNGTAASFTINSATRITATVPTGAATGNVAVANVNGTGNGVSFTVLPDPTTVVSLSPARNTVGVPINLGPNGFSVTLNRNWASGVTAQNSSIFVHSQQLGKKGGTYSVSGNSNYFHPLGSFRHGETIFTTVTTASGLRDPYVYQFTVASVPATATFGAPRNHGSEGYLNDAALADIDGDGWLDVVATNDAYVVAVMKNSSSGTLTRTDIRVGANPESVAVGDLNGDGHVDIVAGINIAEPGFTMGGISVLLNTGSGTFGAPAKYSLGENGGNSTRSVAVGDVDGDGDLDIVTGNYNNGTISLLLNNGNGTFATATKYNAGSGRPTSITLADLDGDGKLDIATANDQLRNVYVLKNTGSGFGAPTSYEVGRTALNDYPSCIKVGDVDGDGKLDIVATVLSGAPNTNKVSVLRNNGPGFDAYVDYLIGTDDPRTLALADLNGDGKLDIVTGAGIYSKVHVLMNNGSGTFGAVTKYTMPTGIRSIVAGDMNNDGKLDIVTANSGANIPDVSVMTNQVLAPTFSSISPTSGSVGDSVTITGTNFFLMQGIMFQSAYVTNFKVNAAGTQLRLAVPAGANTGNVEVYNTVGTSNSLPFTVIPIPTITSISPSSGPVGTTVTITGTNFNLATGIRFGGGLATNFKVNSNTEITATVAEVTSTGDIFVVTANGVVFTGASFTVLSSPSIGLPNITKTYGDADFNLSATSNSSGAITYSAISGTAATVSSAGAVSITGTGFVGIRVSQAADGNYTAGEITSMLNIIPLSNTISFTNPGTKTFGDADFNLTASVSSGGPITFSVVDGPAIIDGNTVAINGAGDITIRASSGATNNYDAAADVTITFTVEKAIANLSFSGLTQTYNGLPKIVTVATVPADLNGVEVTYRGIAAPPTDAGLYPIAITLSNPNYKLADNDPATATLNIGRAVSTTTVSIAGGPFPYTGAAQTPATVLVTGAGGLSFTPPATYVNNIDAGTATTSFTFGGDPNHIGSEDSKNFVIGKASATITLTAADLTQTYSGNGKTVGYTTNPAGITGVSVTYSQGGNAVGSPTVAGSYSVLASLTNDNYLTTSATGTLVIGKAPATVTLGSLTPTYSGSSLAATATTDPTGLIVNFTYDGATSAPTNAGSYTVAGIINDNNYTGSASGSLVINKAASVTTVTIAGAPFTYTGSSQTPATVSVTGAGGLNLTPTAGYANNTNAGTATASYTYAGDANHEGSTDSKTFEIGKAASSTTVTINGAPFTYTGSAQTPATVSVTGAGALSMTPAAAYANNTAAGTATASYTFAGDANHTGSEDRKTFVIGKAAATIVVQDYSGVYDGNAHGTTGSARGVNGETLTGLNLGSSFDNVPGGDATWTYTDATGNYNNATGTAAIVIGKAEAVINVTPYTVTYDGSAHTASGTAKGVKSENLSGLTLTSTTHTAAGTYAADAWTFTDITGNYNNSSGSVTNVINKAQLTVTANDKSKVYDGRTYTGGGGVFTSGYSGFITGESEANVAIAGNITYTGTATTAIDASTTPYSITPVVNGLSAANYTFSPAIGTLTINKAEACVTYNGDLFKNTTSTTGGSATVSLSVVITGTSGEDVRTAQIVRFKVNGTAVTGTITKTWNSVTPGQVSYSIPYTVALSSTELSKTFDITWDLAGNYSAAASCSDGASQVTVSAPSADFITGGGYIRLTNSYGKYAGDVDTKNSFGFSVKWNKSFSTIQGGGINSIIRKGTTLYQIKGTKVTALKVISKTATAPATATFTSNAVVSTIVNGVVVSSEGSCTAIVEISDICEPGSGAKASSDGIAITVKDKNGVVIYSSKWDATAKKTIKQTLDGGNIQIRNGSTTGAPTCTFTTQTVTTLRSVYINIAVPEVTNATFGLKAFPNPSATQFNVQLQSSNTTDKITLRVFDVNGRTVRVMQSLTAGQTVQLGSAYRPGIYFVEMLQGKARTQVKLLKAIY